MNKHIPILLGIIFVCLAVWLLITPAKSVRLLLDHFDQLGYDLQLKTRILTHTAPQLDNVAIIDIDDKSLQAVGRWPWPRNKIAQLVNDLQTLGAVVIAFDFFFPEKENNIAEIVLSTLTDKNQISPPLADELKKSTPFFDNDSVFAQSLTNAQSVLALTFLPRSQTQNDLPPAMLTLTPLEQGQLGIYNMDGYISNIPILQQAAKASGFINIFSDDDGIIRRAPLLIQHNGMVYGSLALQAVMSYLNKPVTLVSHAYDKVRKLEGIQLGNVTIPTDEAGQVFIPFVGKSYTFPYYSAIDVLEGKISKDQILGKILFIGTSATGLGDLKATSIQNPFPGVEVQATLANGMLQNNFSYKPAWTLGANLFLTILFGVTAAFLFPFLGPRTLGTVILVLPPILLFINNWVWERTGLILSLLMPVCLVLVLAMLSIIYGYLFETRRREHLKEMFGQYVPAKHIDEMLKSTGNYGLHGEDREMTVLFADIRDFTTISEKLSASELVHMLNTFFTPMTEIIFQHSGTIDKYVGDLIMAFWGAPLRDKNHSRHAIESALEMQAKVRALRSIFMQNNWPEIKIGIGINSGKMSVGDMGSRYRRNYTVLGDAVNLASRVEGLTKYYGVNIIVTENTIMPQSKFIFRKLDLVKVKGKKEGVAIYEVLGEAADLTPELNEELIQYHKALDDYFHQNWERAYELMNILYQKFPQKRIYHLYLERIKIFQENPPAPSWDGVYVHTTK